MSDAWNRHYQGISNLIAANPVARYTPPPPVAPAPTTLPSWAAYTPDIWQGGSNMGDFGLPPAAGDGGNWGLSPQAIGGLLGAMAGGLAGGPMGGLLGGIGGRALAGALGSAAGPQATAQPTAPGIGSLGGEGFADAGAGPGAFGGGLGDLGAAEMGLGIGGLGAMSGAEIMGFQRGGYTGAGRDGRVQPERVAGVVHEGELVIPHHLVRRMGLLGR